MTHSQRHLVIKQKKSYSLSRSTVVILSDLQRRLVEYVERMHNDLIHFQERIIRPT